LEGGHAVVDRSPHQGRSKSTITALGDALVASVIREPPVE
jgi:hypothetical protein